MNDISTEEAIQTIEEIIAEPHDLFPREVAAFTRAIAALKAKSEAPTPESLRRLADFFDDPKNPAVSYTCKNVGGKMTAGFMLRMIAEDFAAALEKETRVVKDSLSTGDAK